MARSAKNRQQDPVPLEQKERKAAKVRSGGKWKRVDAQGKLIKPPSKKGAAANTDADEQAPSKKSKKAAAKKGGGGGGSGSESEDEELDAARAAFFDDEDLDEGEGGFEGREDDLDLENGSDAGFESNDSYDLEDEPLEGEPENGLDSEDVNGEADALPRLPAKAMPQSNAPPSDMGSEEMQQLMDAGSEDEEDEEGDSAEDGSVDFDLLEEANGDQVDEDEPRQPVSVSTLKARMASAVRALGDWKHVGQQIAGGTKSRSDVMNQFIQDVCEYYGYNAFLAEKLIELFPIDEAIAFLDASDTPRPVTIRVNTLRTRRRELAQALINRGVNLEPLGKWTKVGLQVFESAVPIGATPEYLAGHYILQAASSFLPVIALDPQPGERVLDMSSAPGGKTTHIAAQLQNSGVVFANDSNKQRSKALGGNVARMGCKNVIICNYDGRDFPKVIGGFDRVLLDAPCSGTGVISKDASVKTNKSERDFMLLSHLQKQLILCAIDSVKPGGTVVYSTCSVTVDENEAVVAYALAKRPHAQLVDTTLEFGREGFKRFKAREFGDKMKLTRRFLPHVTNMDGFFVSKFHVGKPQKKNPEAESVDVDDAPPSLFIDGDDVGEANATTTHPQKQPAFDEDEDDAIIQEGLKRNLKRKGIKPVDAARGQAKKQKKEGDKQ